MKTLYRVHMKMFIMIKLILLAYVLRTCHCESSDLDGNQSKLVAVREESVTFSDTDLNSTLFRTVKSYFCRAPIDGDEELILYGAKAWSFPPQDVNLTLRYPSHNMPHADYEKNHGYLLTGLKVVFQLAGSESKGFITGGGMHQDNISMMFVFRNVTRLSYQLYLYGTRRDLLNINEIYTADIHIC